MKEIEQTSQSRYLIIYCDHHTTSLQLTGQTRLQKLLTTARIGNYNLIHKKEGQLQWIV